ncbi:MAG TPA: hypothetical protein VE996_06105 [Terriglobales bacterium]|nr:hypothetical protein [Terriglobales bacterium]
MSDQDFKLPSASLTDEQISTERRLPRRSFLTAVGTMFVGAAAVVASARAASASSLQSDPDAKKPKNNKKSQKHAAKGSKHAKKAAKPKASDPDH